MLHIAICDDENKIREDITGTVRNYFEGVRITQFGNGHNLLESFNRQSFDMVLLDIDMPEISGLDIAGMIKNAVPKPLIVFVTSHDELVYDSLRFHPFGFVRKSHLDLELKRVLSDGEAEIESREKNISLHTAEGDVRISLRNILYFESDGNYIKAVTETEEYRFRETMQSLVETLRYDGFVRVHKGFLVNAEAVKVFNSEKCTLTNGVEIPMGRAFVEEARRYFMRSMVK